MAFFFLVILSGISLERFGLQRSGSFCSRTSKVHDFRKSNSVVLYLSFKDGEQEEEDPWALKESAGTRTTVTTSFGSESVPQEQRPTNEYLNLLQQPLFGWASQETGNIGLFQRLFLSYSAIFCLVCYPIAGATFTAEGFLLQKIASANLGAILFVFALLLRLYSGWGFVGARLQSKIIEYEETGWYDGNYERKTKAESARDLFLYRKDVKPVEDRLKVAMLIVSGILVVSLIALNISLSAKPLFDQYDPELLKVLQVNDDLAEMAASKSNGKPTYCDNRYYSALANGGQGCK